MDQDDMDVDDPSPLPSQPLYAQMKARQRPSPKGEQRLWLYQCAQKSCSRGETKISGTSRPKGRDVPSCAHCNGKMHWKGTERHPSTQSGTSPTSNDGIGRPMTGSGGSGSSFGQPGSVRQMPGLPFPGPLSSSPALSYSHASHSSTSSRPHSSLGLNVLQFQHDTRPSTSTSGSTAMTSDSTLPADQRGGGRRPWEL